MGSRRRSHVAAHRLFFPAAALHAAIALPLSVLGMLGVLPLHSLAAPAAHGHEMLLGFALAVVAGFLINRVRRLWLWILFAIWLTARISFLVAPQTLFSHLFNIGFAAGLGALIAPQFMGAAKKWRNQAFAPIILGLCTALVVFHLAAFAGAPQFQSLALREATLLLALLMGFMGGRVIVPAVAGHLQTMGLKLYARVQPRLEGAFLLLMAAALILNLLPSMAWATALLLAAASGVCGTRLWRWQLWRCGGRSDLVCLAVGYLWLIVGLLLLAVSYLPLPLNPTTALHAITVGALGTLTLTVMARTRMIKAHRQPGGIRGLVPAVLLLTLAALLRLFGATSTTLLFGAAVFWSIAFLLLLLILIRAP